MYFKLTIFYTSLFAAPPSNYQVTYGGSRSIVVTWNAPHSSDGNVMQYTIIVQSPDDLSFFRQRDIVDSNAIQYIVDGVTPATTYECCLTVRTDLGDSPFSCASNTTNEDSECVCVDPVMLTYK